MDSGNLVLLGDDRNLTLWESFENPSDTFLPGMKMDTNLKLTSWKSVDDPGSGNFSFKMAEDNRFIILNRSEIFWESEEYGRLILDPNFDQFHDISSDVINLLTNFSVIQWEYQSGEGDLFVRWKQPKTNCSIYNVCGDFASCNDDDYELCKCLPGFDKGKGDSSLQDNKVGCIRRTSLSRARSDTPPAFLNLTMIKTGRPDVKVMADGEENCKSTCLEKYPLCQAYSYAPLTQRTLNPSTCWIWTHNLTTLKEDYTDGDDDRRLFALVDNSDIKPTPRTCEPCGTNIVPYPLSTGSNCGDLTYFKFSCNSSTGQLSFNTTDNVSYRVIRVVPNSRTFTIKVNSLNQYCDEGSDNTGNLKVSSPYSIIGNNFCSEHVDISWEPPSETGSSPRGKSKSSFYLILGEE
ncbi:hypothetical protein TSUD_270600 [Trifolium subterraneum]|uniref:Apple domain-containing protein n=1 Tax=Trifolium subterraneum TaxID=3900 RepID=A0A2Z6P962_TRISU|nr:hypothetical protein TSUD_270600 [Trifolium subterraneum]